MTSVLILAGGSSERMNGINKQFAELCGVPVIVRSALAFEQSENVSEIIIVTRECDIEKIKALCSNYGISKLKAVVSGGNSRAESALRGAEYISSHVTSVAVHDGARPLVKTEQIDEAIKAAETNEAAILAVPSKDTIKCVEADIITDTPPRECLWLAQTPQVFSYSLYMKMLRQDSNVTDDSMLAEMSGANVNIVNGSYDNIKITTPDDIDIAEVLLKRREKC